MNTAIDLKPLQWFVQFNDQPHAPRWETMCGYNVQDAAIDYAKYCFAMKGEQYDYRVVNRKGFVIWSKKELKK